MYVHAYVSKQVLYRCAVETGADGGCLTVVARIGHQQSASTCDKVVDTITGFVYAFNETQWNRILMK